MNNKRNDIRDKIKQALSHINDSAKLLTKYTFEEISLIDGINNWGVFAQNLFNFSGSKIVNYILSLKIKRNKWQWNVGGVLC